MRWNEPLASYQGGLDGGGIEKPLSFCLVMLYILTPDVPTLKVRSWNKPKNSKASLPEEILLRFSSLFSANNRKLGWTLRVNLKPEHFFTTFAIILSYLEQRNTQRINSFHSFNHLLYGYLMASLKKALRSLALLFYCWISPYYVWQ